MNTVYLVVANSGDGSSHIEFYCDPSSITRLEELAADGDDQYATGDGLSVTELNIPLELDTFAAMQPKWFRWSDGNLVDCG